MEISASAEAADSIIPTHHSKESRTMTLNKMNFLITGAGRGIGRGLSRHLLSGGHRVFLLDANATELEHTVSVLGKTYQHGQDFDSSVTDLRDPAQIKNAAAQADALFGGRLDCLVNNAAYTGGVGGMKLEDMTVEEWEKSLSVNLTGPMLMTQACLRMLSKNAERNTAGGGCVVHVSSTRAFQSEPHNEAYSTTKAGLVGMTQSMAVSLAEKGIRVSAVLPGWIHVADECKAADEAGTKWEEGLSEEDARWQLTGRVGKVEDVARAVLYLAENEGVTGVEMVVDGGVTRKMVYPE
jgi:NAD(P)-dependent dehydrogenase (short-subunit alcohol dehydrogenase family)